MRPTLHDDEAGALKVLNDTLRGDCSHILVRVVDALAAVEAKRIRNRFGQVARVRGGKVPKAARSGASSRREQSPLPTLAGFELIAEDVASHDGSLRH